MNRRSPLGLGQMEWEDDLDGLREVMKSIAAAFLTDQKSRNSKDHQRRSIAYLKSCLHKVMGKQSVLDTLHHPDSTIAKILNELLKSCDCSMIRNIRYYRYYDDSGDGAYVLIDSAGYDRDSAQRLRVGELIRFQSSCKLNWTDTFWAHSLGVPVAVSVDRQAPSCIEPKYFSGCLPLMEIPRDACEETLQNRQTSMWIDIPLEVVGEPTGKLSCDFAGEISDLSSANAAIVDFWAKSQTAAAVLECLASKNRFDVPINEIVADIQACRTSGDLYDFCVARLPTYFGCKNASVFTVSTDSLAVSRLVLQRTSYGPARRSEGLSPYAMDDTALTSWVARNNKSLRVHNLSDASEREYQLDQYRAFDSKLMWKDRLRDSDCHTSFLAVPIPIDANRVGGVIRFTEKTGCGTLFSEQDQLLLERIAKDAIGRRLASIQAMEGNSTLSYRGIQHTNALLVSDRVPTTLDISATLQEILAAAFPETTGRKLFLLNVITNDCRQLQHFPVGGSLQNSLEPFAFYDLEGSLTGYVVAGFLRRRNDAADSVGSTYINDFENAKRHGAMLEVCEDALAAIACPVAYRRKIYGVLIVKSDRFDISLEQCSHPLQIIAAQAGTLFARRDHARLTQLRKEMEEKSSVDELAAWLTQLERTFQENEATFRHALPNSLNLKEVVTRAAEDAGCGSCGIGAQVQDVEVVAHEQPLLSIMYSVLKDVCLRTDGPPQIHGSVRDQWIEVTVKEFFRNADPLQGELWDDDYDGDDNASLAFIRKLAYYNEIESRCGTIEQSDNDLVLRVPAG